jgi:hypothetical protein
VCVGGKGVNMHPDKGASGGHIPNNTLYFRIIDIEEKKSEYI